MFRLLQIMDILFVLPIVLLGLMVGMSGGGSNQWNQEWSKQMFRLAPLGIAGAIVAEVIWWLNLEPIAYVVASAPLVVWLVMLVRLQRKTHFFFQQKKRKQ